MLLKVKNNLIVSLFFIAAFSASNSYAISLNQEKVALADIDNSSAASSPWASTTITYKKIAESGATTIPEALKLIPGFVQAHPFGSYGIASYGGLQDEYPRATRIEVDDVPVNMASTGSVFWESLPVSLEDVSRITFISTPLSAINGEQSFNGVIKIYTYSADEQDNLMSASVGTKGHKRLYARATAQLSEKTHGLMSFYKERGDGAFEEVSSVDRYKIWSNLIHKKDSYNTILMNFGYGFSHDDAESNSVMLSNNNPAYKDRKTEGYNARLVWSNTKDGNLKVILGAVKTTNVIDNLVENGTIRFDINYSSLRKFGMVEYSDELNETTRYKAAIGVRVDDETPEKFSRSEDHWFSEMREMSLSAEHDIDDKTILFAALSGHQHSLFEDMSSYALGVTRNLDNKQSLSLLVSNGFRFPVNWESRSEHYVTLVANPSVQIVRNDISPEDVAPEQVASISVKYDFVDNYDKKVSVALFHKQYTDMMYQDFVPFLSGIGLYSGNTTVNKLSGERVNTTGLELHSIWPIAKNHSLTSSYAFNNISYPSSNVTDMESIIPAHVFTAMLNSKLGNGVNLSLGVNHVSEQNWVIDDTNESKKITKPYTTASAGLKKCYPAGSSSDSLCITGFAKNILGPVTTLYDEDIEPKAKEDLLLGFKVNYNF